MDMKTIFDYKPTDKELAELFRYDKDSEMMVYGFSIVPQPIDTYNASTSKEEKILDLAQLLELRGQQSEADALWEQIPEIALQYRHGFDNVSVPVA